jgi:hypothetical protein
MEKKMIEDIKEFFQSWLAPQLEGIKGDIRALDSKIDAKSETSAAKFATVLAKIEAVDSKAESFRRELLSEDGQFFRRNSAVFVVAPRSQ